MRIGIDCRTLTRPLTGVRRYLQNLLPQMAQAAGSDAEFTLFLDGEGFPGCLNAQEGLRPIHVRWPLVSDQPGRNWMAPIWLNTALVASLGRQDVDACFFPNVLSPLWGSCPYVVKVWDMSPYVLTESQQDPLWRRYVRALLPWVVRRAARIIVPSQSTRASVSAYLPVSEEKVHVIYEAVDPAYQILPNSAARPHVSRHFGLAGPFILHVGQITGRKNLGVLLHAFRELSGHRGFSSLRLVLCGGAGHGAEKVTQAINELGLATRVLVTGRVSDEDLLALYNAADVFAFPSLREGFGLPVLEAMACGTPVIASNNSSLPEVVGEAGILLDPLDVKAWSDALGHILVDASVRNDLRTRGLERVTRFSWSRTANQTLSVLKSAVTGGQML